MNKLFCIIVTISMVWNLAAAQPDSYEPIFHITGPTSTSWIGADISNCSDQDGDGSDELLISVADLDEVWMFYGGGLLDTIPDIVFGPNLGAVGAMVYCQELNSIEHGSLLIGRSLSGSSKIYLYDCDSELDTTCDMTFQGANQYNEGFGLNIGVGDINGDGWNDFVTSSHQFDPGGGADRGQIYVFFGGLEMDNIADFTITAAYADLGDRLGSGLAVGDVNGDGYADILATTSSPRKAYLFYGGVELDSIPDWSYEQWPGYLNTSASVIPNLNGDQYADIFLQDVGGNTIIFLGGDPPGDIPDQTIFLAGPSYAGDLNGDLLDDFIGLTMTSVKIYHGGLSGAVYSGSITPAYTPYGVGYCGDVNGDGVDDIAFNSWEPLYYGQMAVYADTTLSSVNREPGTVSRTFTLLPAYPNPFNAQTVIPFTLDRAGKVELTVYDVLGREMRVQQAAPLQAGMHEFVWNAEGMASGVYLVRLSVDGNSQGAGTLLHTQARKVVLVK